MPADDIVKLVGAVAAATTIILGAIGALWAKIHGYRAEVNGKMTELLDLTRQSARAEGRQIQRTHPDAPDPPVVR